MKMLRHIKANQKASHQVRQAQLAQRNVLLPTSELNKEPRRIRIDHNEKELQLAIERKAV